MQLRNRTWLGLILAGMTLLAFPGAAFAQPPTLSGVYLDLTNDATFNVQCDRAGTSTFMFHATGTTANGYRGTYVADGSATIGTQDIGTADSYFASYYFGLDAGPVVSFQETFSIDSPSTGTTIAGTKQGVLTVTPPGFPYQPLIPSVCGSFDNTSNGSRQHGEVQHFVAYTSYQATIHAPDGTFHDEGLAFAQALHDDYFSGPLDYETTNTVFGASFLSTLSETVPVGDADGDGVDDSIGTGSGGFQDVIANQVATTGQVVSVDPGLTVHVQDAADPDGVLVTVGPGAGRATLSLCGGFTVRIAAGSSAVLTCGSITVKTLTGSATVELASGITTVTVPATGVARVSDSGAGRFTVANQGAVAVSVKTSGVSSTVAPQTTTTLAVVTIANVCSLAKSYVQGSARYAALTAKQKQTVDVLATAACAILQKITPKLSAKQKADLITGFRSAIQALVPPGWLTQKQADTVKSLAGTL